MDIEFERHGRSSYRARPKASVWHARKSFAREGAKVIIAGPRCRAACPLRPNALKSRRGAATLPTFTGDLASCGRTRAAFCGASGCRRACQQCRRNPRGQLARLTLERWTRSWQLKVFGYIHLTQLYLDAMKQPRQWRHHQHHRHGRVRSRAGIMSAAPAGNAALIALTRAVGAKSVDWNVRVVRHQSVADADRSHRKPSAQEGAGQNGRRGEMARRPHRVAFRPSGRSFGDRRSGGDVGVATRIISQRHGDRCRWWPEQQELKVKPIKFSSFRGFVDREICFDDISIYRGQEALKMFSDGNIWL